MFAAWPGLRMRDACASATEEVRARFSAECRVWMPAARSRSGRPAPSGERWAKYPRSSMSWLCRRATSASRESATSGGRPWQRLLVVEQVKKEALGLFGLLDPGLVGRSRTLPDLRRRHPDPDRKEGRHLRTAISRRNDFDPLAAGIDPELDSRGPACSVPCCGPPRDPPTGGGDDDFGVVKAVVEPKGKSRYIAGCGGARERLEVHFALGHDRCPPPRVGLAVTAGAPDPDFSRRRRRIGLKRLLELAPEVDRRALAGVDQGHLRRDVGRPRPAYDRLHEWHWKVLCESRRDDGREGVGGACESGRVAELREMPGELRGELEVELGGRGVGGVGARPPTGKLKADRLGCGRAILFGCGGCRARKAGEDNEQKAGADAHEVWVRLQTVPGYRKRDSRHSQRRWTRAVIRATDSRPFRVSTAVSSSACAAPDSVPLP